ncbi:MAG: hypothetical protein EOP45_16715 [Sphingobacteriaceae bacterium]|nr:MAG: hypothetical protein EOP45_16715 [Sphingobacteriaceae bacterium]
MKNTLSSMFCTRNSNFAFKCVNCKNFDLFKHENSIQLNNTFVANVDSVGKDTTNSNIASKNAVSGTDSNAIESEKSSDGNSINTTSSNVHPSDLNAESKNLHYDKLIKRNMNIHQDATNQGGSNLTMPSCSLPTDSSAISTPKTDDTFSIHLTKFDVDKKWTDIAEYITVMTSLKLDTHFTVLKLLPKAKGSRRSLSFVSFKIVAANKDVFDKIMSPNLWNPDVVASKFNSSISRLKRSQREIEATQGNKGHKTHKIKVKQSSNDGNFHQHQHDRKNNNNKGANKNNKSNFQNKQHHKQQQQQPKRQQKPQQQQQQPHGRKNKHQQKQQPQSRKNGQHNQRRGNQLKGGNFNNQNFNGLPHPGNFNPHRGSNFHPTWWNNQPPAINTSNRRDQLFNILQQFFAQQPQF